MNLRQSGLVVLWAVFSRLACWADDAALGKAGVEGYAGPGWTMLAGKDGFSEMASLGPLMFEIGAGLHFGPQIAYEESAAEGPGIVLGGIKAEFRLDGLSAGPYHSSFTAALMGGADGLGSTPEAAFQASVGLDANLLIAPGLALAVGPVAALRWSSGEFLFLPGLAFSLKEGSAKEDERALLDLEKRGLRIGGSWQGQWHFTEAGSLFIDGGGTRLILDSGWAFGIGGGVLRQRVEDEGSSLAVMLTGLTAERNIALLPALCLVPRLSAGLALCGWVDEEGGMDGGAFFMARPELSVQVAVFSFLELGAGVGYAFLLGDPRTEKPLPSLQAPTLSIQARVGGRKTL